MEREQVEATEVATLFDRTRLRTARQLRGYSQVQLARAIGSSVTAASLSQFEKGHSRPSAATLRKLSAALKVPIGFFTVPARPTPSEDIDGYFRSLRSTKQRDRDRALAYVQLARELTIELERVVKLPLLNIPKLTRPAHPDFSQETFEQIARDTRNEWRVDAGPIPDVIRLLERNGIITTRFRTELAEVDAFCVTFPDRPIVTLGADKGQRDRSRFDAAHELGHLIMHSPESAGDKLIEKQANQFAAAFLMPRNDIVDELPSSADWPQLMKLKNKWQVSIAALLVRAKTLDVMDDRTYIQAWKTLSVRGWRKREPGELGQPEEPVLLRRAIQVAEDTGHSFRKIIDAAFLPWDDVNFILGGSSDELPVVEI